MRRKLTIISIRRKNTILCLSNYPMIDFDFRDEDSIVVYDSGDLDK